MGAQAVGSLEATRAVPTIQRALGMEDKQDVQIALLGALGRVGTPNAVKLLIDAAQPGGLVFGRKPKALRLAAIKALATIDSPEAQEALAPMKNDKDSEVRAAAVAPSTPRMTQAMTPLDVPAV
jgi:HEAT repeat protein